MVLRMTHFLIYLRIYQLLKIIKVFMFNRNYLLFFKLFDLLLHYKFKKVCCMNYEHLTIFLRGQLSINHILIKIKKAKII